MEVSSESIDTSGVIVSVTEGSFKSKTGNIVKKYTLKMPDGQSYDGFGDIPPGVKEGVKVDMKYIKKGAFNTVKDLSINGVSVIEKKPWSGYNSGSSGGAVLNTKELEQKITLLSAVILATHNMPGKEVAPSDIEAYTSKLKEMAKVI